MLRNIDARSWVNTKVTKSMVSDTPPRPSTLERQTLIDPRTTPLKRGRRPSLRFPLTSASHHRLFPLSARSSDRACHHSTSDLAPAQTAESSLAPMKPLAFIPRSTLLHQSRYPPRRGLPPVHRHIEQRSKAVGNSQPGFISTLESWNSGAYRA